MVRRLLLITLVTWLAVSSGCASAREKAQVRYAEGLRPFEVHDLNQAEVDLVWQVPLSGLEKRDRVQVRNAWVFEETLLVEAQNNTLYAFDRETGATSWLVIVAGPLQVQPVLHDRRFYSVSAGRLIAVDTRGELTVGARFPVSASAPLLVTDDYIYAPAAGQGLVKLDKEQLLSVWPAPARTRGAILGRPVRVEDVVAFATSAGEVVAVDYITGARRIDLKDFGSIYSGVVSDGANFYFASTDYYVYSYTLLGSPEWRTLIEGRVSRAPHLASDRLYVSTMNSGLWALSKLNGAPIWHNPRAGQIMSTGGGNVWTSGPMGELWLLDAATGAARERIDGQTYSFRPINAFDDGFVYLVSDDGVISCIRAR